MGGEAVLGQLNGSISKLETFSPRMTAAINSTTDHVNALLSSVPAPLQWLVDDIVKKAKELLAWIGKLAGELCDWVAENVWPVIKGPYTLYEAGNKWTTTVYNHVSEVSGQLDLSKTSLEDYWQGPAANAYMQTVPVQKAASDKVGTMVSATRETLQGMAFTLGSLYIAVVAGLFLALIEILGGSAAVATMIGIPPGLMAIVTGLLTGIATVAGLYALGKELLQGSLEKFSKLLELKNDSSAFDKGHWPKATSDLGDGSMSDGSRSKWNYKR
jgi:hypothetical protein